MAFWNKLVDKIQHPDLKNVEYRESHATILADNKLWFFGLRGVSPTSMNFHETTLLGGFVSVFDIKTKQWSFKNLDKLDDDENHREHIFAVRDKIFMYVYSTEGKCYQKLLTLKDDKWQEVKLDSSRCSAIKLPSCLHFINTADGFYVLYEHQGTGHVAKMEISSDNDVKQTQLAEVPMVDIKGNGVHLTGLAFNDAKMFAWYGQQGCGFRWEPKNPLFAELKSQPAHFHPKTIEGPYPPYAFSGPSNSIMHNNQWIMLGGSRQKGMSQCEDVHEIWVFDMDSQVFSKTNAETPKDVPRWRSSTAFDHSSGNVYMCDVETGIYVANLNNLQLCSQN